MNKISEISKECLKRLEKSQDDKLKTGFIDLDYALNGIKNGEFIIVASRPAMGKSSLVQNIIINNALNYEKNIALFSLGMSKEIYTERIFSTLSLVESKKIIKGKIDDNELKKIKDTENVISKLKLYIDDEPFNSIKIIKEKCRKLKLEQKIDLVVIDDLNLTDSEFKIDEICSKLKKLAEELNIVIIVTTNLSRNLEKREDKRPRMSDILSDGVTLKNSDVIMFLYRENYYNSNLTNKDVAEIIIAKNKYGYTGTIKLEFINKYLKYKNIEDKICNM